MRVIFLEDVPHMAQVGDVKDVTDGYGRNYLLPNKLAVLATPAELKRLERQSEHLAQRRAQAASTAQDLATLLEETPLVFKAKVGARGRLYGSITGADIAARIKEVTGHELDKRRVVLESPIHELGTKEVILKLPGDVTARANVTVEAETA